MAVEPSPRRATLLGMQTVTEASHDQLVRMSRYASQEGRALLQGADMQIMRVLSELCAPDLEPYDPGAKGDEEAVATLMLAGEPPCGILDIEVSGTYRDPKISMELLPVGQAPLTASMVEESAPGEPGGRPRRVRWNFHWDSGRQREIFYDIERNGNAASHGSDARRRTALMLAQAAGWPLP